MTKLCQIVAVEKGIKATAHKHFTAAHQVLQKREQLRGFTKTYRPKDEEGENFPSENKKVQFTVNGLIAAVKPDLIRMFDVVATKETANTQAKADVMVNGQTVIKDAPVTMLLFLEKQLTDIHTFVSGLPTLAPDQEWSVDPVSGLWRTPERESHRTKKVTNHVVVVPPTDKHPAQVVANTEDVIVGHWRTVDLSGETSPVGVKEMLARIESLQRAVQMAREQANSMEIKDVAVGEQVLGFIFGS